MFPFGVKHPIIKWSVREVAKFLDHQNIPLDIIRRFEDEEINGEALLLVDESDLIALGVSKLGPRRILLARIDELKTPSVSRSQSSLSSFAPAESSPIASFSPSISPAPAADHSSPTSTSNVEGEDSGVEGGGDCGVGGGSSGNPVETQRAESRRGLPWTDEHERLILVGDFTLT